jgi:hypothetical protein
MKLASEFDHDHWKKIQQVCLKAIIEASVDPATGAAVLRNGEISKALLQISAMLMATYKEVSSPTQIRHLAETYAKEFRQLVTADRVNMDEDGGPPFPVLHRNEL